MVYNISMINEAELRNSLKNVDHDKLVDMIVQMSYRNDNLQANYDALRKKYYGTKKSDSAVKGQLCLFNEAEETVDESTEKELLEPSCDEIIPKKKKKNKTPRNAKLKRVTVKEENIYPDDRNCPECGKPMQELKPTIIEQIEYVPAQYVLHRFVIHNFTCHSCNEENLDCEIYTGDTSKIPARLIEGSIVTPSVVANIAANKFMLGLPFYRQSKDLEYRGIEISRQNLCQWMMRVGQDYLEVVFQRMVNDLRNCGIVNMDETTLEVLEDVRENQRSKSYTWLAMSGKYETNQMALYFYNATREHKFVNEILGLSFHGVIQSDGYAAYDNYASAKGHAGCSSHCQRKFTEAAQSYAALYKAYTSAKSVQERKELLQKNPSFALILHVLEQFTALFEIEKQLKEDNADSEMILKVRDEKERPYWEEIRKTVDRIKENYVLSSKLSEAVTYIDNQWDKLLYYLTNWKVQIDNNLAEREGIKPFVMSRKNFIFSDTRSGARISAIYFSLLISARMNQLNPEKYLTYLLSELSTYGLKDDVIERCLPYSKVLPEDLKISKNHSS